MRVKTKKGEYKKFLVGGAIAQAAVGLGSAIYGGVQARRANKELRRLNRERPAIEVPEAIRRLAAEPIAESYIRAQEMGAQRRTGQAVDAASRLGSRGTLGVLPSVLDNERIGEQQRFGQYEQARQQALGMLGNAELDVQNRENQRWLQQVAGSQAELNAGNQNIFGGLSGMGMGLGFLSGQMKPDEVTPISSEQLNAINKIKDFSRNMGNPFSNPIQPFGSPTFMQQQPTQQQGVFDNTQPKRSLETGGFITEGEFSHKTNPIHMINDEGKKVGEATGDEIIINPEQQEKIEKESIFAKRLFNKFRKQK